MSNTCINEKFSDTGTLSKNVDENCEKIDPVDVKPFCEAIEKCPLGEKCCRLSMFKSATRELRNLEHVYDMNVDAISYNNNPNAESLLVVSFLFPNLKIYDASNCSIREIFWVNFKGFYELESINLANNRISALNEKLLDKTTLKSLNLCKLFYF